MDALEMPVYQGNIQPLPDTTQKIDVKNLSVLSFQGVLLLFLDKRYEFAYRNERFYNPSIPSIEEGLATINGMPHQLFAGDLEARYVCHELKKFF